MATGKLNTALLLLLQRLTADELKGVYDYLHSNEGLAKIKLATNNEVILLPGNEQITSKEKNLKKTIEGHIRQMFLDFEQDDLSLSLSDIHQLFFKGTSLNFLKSAMKHVVGCGGSGPVKVKRYFLYRWVLKDGSRVKQTECRIGRAYHFHKSDFI